MNKKISTRTGLMTGVSILGFILILKAANIHTNSPLIFISYLLLFIGILFSCFMLYKYYADIKFTDAFTHCIKTGITALVIVMIGSSIMYYVFTPQKSFADYNLHLMKIIFSYSFSGLLSSFFTSYIFNTFANKKK